MRVELGEMTQEAFDQYEADVLEAIRQIRERREGGPRGAIEFSAGGGSNVEATFTGDAMGGTLEQE